MILLGYRGSTIFHPACGGKKIGSITRHSSRFINFGMFFIYILQSKKNNSYYIGSCKNIEKRFNQHNSGLTKSIKNLLPFNLIYSESFNNLKEARKRELQIKSWKSRKAIEKLIKHSKI